VDTFSEMNKLWQIVARKKTQLEKQELLHFVD